MKLPWKLLLAAPALVFLGNAWAQPAGPAPKLVKAPKLVAHLRDRYPNLEVHLLKGMLSLNSKYPGLVFGLPRHLLEDLGDEPAQALADVIAAERERYPQMPGRIAEMRKNGRTALAGRFPGLRTQLFQFAVSNPSPRAQMRSDAQAVLQGQFPNLRSEVRLEVSKLLDERAPGQPLSRELLRQNAPEAIGRVAPMLRPAALAVLARWEQDPACQPHAWAAKMLDWVAQNRPTLLPELLDRRIAARLQLLHEEFPEAIPVALNTIRSKHPQLREKIRACVQKHYPDLRQDVEAAVEAELPGFRQEVRAYFE